MHDIAARRGADGRHGRAIDAGQCLDDDLRERQQRSGIAGGDDTGSLAPGDGVDRHAH